MSKRVLVETSARHVHLCRKDMDILFGPGSELHNKKNLSQPGQFAGEERVDVVGPKRTLGRVSVLGPLRPESQVEMSLTDARTIGADAPIRESGNTVGSAGCKLVGPKGEVELAQGLIVAQRHVHATPEEAAELGIQDKQVVSVKIDTNGRSLILGDVVVRVRSDFALAMHIDTDEANAADASGEVYGEIIK